MMKPMARPEVPNEAPTWLATVVMPSPARNTQLPIIARIAFTTERPAITSNQPAPRLMLPLATASMYFV